METINRLSERVIGTVGYFFLSLFLDVVELVHDYHSPPARRLA